MESIRIDTGKVRIAINDDENRVIEFNPNDAAFADKFYQLVKNFNQKIEEYETRAKSIDENKTVDEFGIPESIDTGIKLMSDICDFMDHEIDNVFGVGTAEMVFEGIKDYDLYEQFLHGLVPFVKASRDKRVAKYIRKR